MTSANKCSSSLSVKKATENVCQFAQICENELALIIKKFSEKDWLGLWWDHTGLCGSSDPSEVSKNLEEFRKLAKNLIGIMKMVEANDTDSLTKLREFNEELEKKEKEAQLGLSQSKSKTVVRMYRDFLKRIKVEIDRKSFKVLCVFQEIVIDDLKKMGEEHKKDAEEQRKQYEFLKEQNQHEVTLIKSSEEKTKQLHDELKSDKQKFQTEMAGRIEKLNEEANQRCQMLQQENQQLKETLMKSDEEAKKGCQALLEENRLLKKMMEESTRKNDECMLRLLEIMKEIQKEK